MSTKQKVSLFIKRYTEGFRQFQKQATKLYIVMVFGL